MQGLCATQDCRQRLLCGAYDIVIGLLGRKRRTGSLRVEAQHHRAWVLRVEAFAHDVRPHATSSSELGDLFKQVVVAIEEEGQLSCECIDIQPGINGGLYITNSVRERKGDFLHCG